MSDGFDICPVCNGSGEAQYHGEKCRLCHGTGEVLDEYGDFEDGEEDDEVHDED